MNTTTTTILGIWLFVVSIIISSTTCAIIKISGIDHWQPRPPSIGPGPGGQPLLVDTSGIQSTATVSGILRVLSKKKMSKITVNK